MRPLRRLGIAFTAGAVMTATAVGPASAASTIEAPVSEAVPVATTSPRITFGHLVPMRTLGGSQSYVSAINRRGDYLGSAMDVTKTSRSVVWWRGRGKPFTLGPSVAGIMAMNNKGHLVGLTSGKKTKVFLWRHGKFTYLPKPAQGPVLHLAVNDRDQIAGIVDVGKDVYRPFLYQHGKAKLLPLAAEFRASDWFLDMNNRGQILSYVRHKGSTARKSVVWQSGRMIKVGTLGGSESVPLAINDCGQVVGNSSLKGNKTQHPFLWQRGRMTDLLKDTRATAGRVDAVSETGMMTGSATWGGRGHLVLWRTPHRMIDLGVRGMAQAVNDRGDVAGFTTVRPGDQTSVPFRWHNGHVMLFVKPVDEIVEERMVGIDSRGTVVVAREILEGGVRAMRSA